LEQSDWPSGPYWLLMPDTGCPETKRHGWDIGYIKFRTNETIQADHGSVFKTSNISVVLQPKLFQINFCYKSGERKNTVSWPNGDYSIFGVENNCPQGNVKYHNMFKYIS
jgi:hypothetical protein